MRNSRNIRVFLCFYFVCSILLAGCIDFGESRSDFLRRLDIENADDFAALSPCKQIEIYASLGSEYTDIDHMTVLAPKWMQDEIDKQPDEVIADCIVGEANKLLSQWGTSNYENNKISYSIHALLYKANELDINKHSQLERLFHRVVCVDHVYYDGQLILIYYTAKFGFENFPTHEAMLSALC